MSFPSPKPYKFLLSTGKVESDEKSLNRKLVVLSVFGLPTRVWVLNISK